MSEKKINMTDAELEGVVGGVTMNDLNRSYAKAHPVIRSKTVDTGKTAFSVMPEINGGVPFSCPFCHGQFQVDGTSNKVVCPSCGQTSTISG